MNRLKFCRQLAQDRRQRESALRLTRRNRSSEEDRDGSDVSGLTDTAERSLSDRAAFEIGTEKPAE